MSIRRFRIVWCLLLLASTATAESLYRRPGFAIQPEVKVRGSEVRLKDIAAFNPGESEFAKLVNTLKDIKIADAPAPLTKSTIIGAQILDLIEATGIPRDSFGYSIPRAIVVEREGRKVTQEEVLSSLKNALWQDKALDIQLREVNWGNDQVVPLGNTRVEALNLGLPSGGKLPVRIEVFVDEVPAARFLATAMVDDWREIPVPNRILERGMLVTHDDIQLVRVNLLQQPADIVSRLDEIVGRRTKGRIGAGETVRKSALDIPPVIEKGKKVNLIYRRGSLLATATGFAVDDGFNDGAIRIKNEVSKKVVIGKVLDPETVEVSN